MTATRTPQGKSTSFKVRPIQKNSISDDIVQQIVTLISNGGLQAGECLPSERDPCVKFGTGRSSIREALRCLAIMGVLDAGVGEGTSVAIDGSKFLEKVFRWRLVTEQHDLETLMEVRSALEGISAAGAARNATPEHLAALEILLSRMEKAVGHENRFAALDLEFHLSIARASGNTLTSDLIFLIRGQLARSLTKVLLLPDAMPLSLKEHTAHLPRHPAP